MTEEKQVVEVGIATESNAPQVVEVEPSQALVPLLGLIVDLNRPNEVAQALKAVRDAKQKLDSVRADLEHVLAEEGARQGIKTLHLEGAEVTISGGPDVEYDQEVLSQLLEAGLPQERYDQLVKTTVTYRVDKNVIRQVLGSGNADYVAIVEKATRHIERPWRVYVK